MKALIVDDYGPPLGARLGELDAPPVKEGYLKVSMCAAGVNPFDYKLVTGAVREFMPIAFPFVPGMDGAGVVVEVGAKVTGWNKGDEVFGMFETGTFAEVALVSATSKRLARKPADLDFVRAAAIPEAGLTASTIVRTAGLAQGNEVLIIGASGGIGLFAIQLAKAHGARVIATGKGDDASYLRDLGADAVVDYGAGDVLGQVKQSNPDGVDVVIDLVTTGGALTADAAVIRSGGKLVSPLGGPDQDAFPFGVTVHYVRLSAKKGELDDLAQRAASGALRIEVGQIYPLAQAGQALADLYDPAKHTRGKLVVQVA